MKRITPFIWALAIIFALGLGIYAGHSVTAAYKDTELMDVRAALEAAQASLADANIELAFWKVTLRGLAEGKQLAGVDFKGRPSEGD